MKRWMKKGIAATLAVTVALGNSGWVSASEIGGKSQDNGDNSVSLLSEAIYDEAVTFPDSVAFLENGHWPREEGHMDYNTYEWIVDKQETNVTTETNIVFMDEEGNKKIIKNKDSNGEKVFDVVFPSISSSDYQLLKIMKDDKASFIKSNGDFFGNEITYYNYAQAITNNLLMISDDEETYQIINSEGEVVADNLKKPYLIREAQINVSDTIFIKNEDGILVLDQKGNRIREYEKGIDIYCVGKGYRGLEDGEKTQLLDPSGNVVREFGKDAQISCYYELDGYMEVREPIKTDDGEIWQTSLVSIATGEVLFKGKGMPKFDGSILIGSNLENIISVSDVAGNTYIPNLEKYAEDLGIQEGYQSVSSSYTYVNETLLLSIMDETDTSRRKTFVLKKENGFASQNATKIEGSLSSVSSDQEYFITGNYSGHVYLCKIDGILIQKIEEDTIYWGGRTFEKYPPVDGKLQDYWGNAVPGSIVFLVSAYSKKEGAANPTRDGVAYISTDGKISSTYKSISADGNFFLAETADGIIQVINTSNELVYSGIASEVEIEGFWYYDCFSVRDKETGKCYLYDRTGKIIFGEDGEYSNIGHFENRGASSWFSSWYYYYRMCLLNNGLCITERQEDGNSKYGVVRINGRMSEGYKGNNKVGDTNGDNFITAADALAVLKHIAGLKTLMGNAYLCADVNADNRVTAEDALDVLRLVAGVINKFKAEK